MITVDRVTRVEDTIVRDNSFGYFIVLRYNAKQGKLEVTTRGRYTDSRAYEPTYVPKAIFTSLIKRGYAVFYSSRRKKEVCVEKNNRQLNLF